MIEVNLGNGKGYVASKPPNRSFWSYFKASEKLPDKYFLVHKWLPYALEFSDVDKATAKFLSSNIWKFLLKNGKVLCER